MAKEKLEKELEKAKKRISKLESFDVDRKLTIRKLDESEERFRAIAESSIDAIITSDADAKIIFWNKAASKMFGYEAHEVLGQPSSIVMTSDRSRSEKKERIEFIETGDSPFFKSHIESIAKKRDGSEFPVDISLSFWQSEGCLFFSAIIRDITERKKVENNQKAHRDNLEKLVRDSTDELRKANKQLQQKITENKQTEEQIKASLAEKEVLLKEIHHRVKNNLSIVSGLMSLQAAGMDSPAACKALAECRDRINTIALVHNTLYRSDNLAKIDYSVYARDLSRAVLDVCGRGGQVKLDISAESVFLEIDKAVDCGLILNELLTNAFKHAFPNGSEGSIRVVFAMRNDGHYSLCVSDNGVGLPADVDFQNPGTLGLKLVSLLTSQLKGSLDVARQNTGTAITITF